MSEKTQQSGTPATDASLSRAVAAPDAPAASSAPVAQVLTRVHKLDSVPERSFWFGHIIFTVLALGGVAFILWARGPRRRDAILSSASEGKG